MNDLLQAAQDIQDIKTSIVNTDKTLLGLEIALVVITTLTLIIVINKK